MQNLAGLMILAFAILWVHPAAAQTVNLTGTVIDAANQEPLIGASVSVVGLKVSAVTDIEGRFTLTNIVPDATIRVSYVGFLPTEVYIFLI